MTIDVLPRKSRTKSTAAEPLPIGEVDANIFDCPACHRPLGIGTRRCPSCGTRLLSSTRATTVLSYGFGGLLIGVLIGGGLALGAVTLSIPRTTTAVAPIATTVPLQTSGPLPTVAPAAGVPTAALSALSQATRLNDRLATDAARLSTALAGRASTSDLARILRSLSANAAFGGRLAKSLATWGDAAPLSVALADFYTDVQAVAQDGLDASLLNKSAYRDAGRRMVRLLGDVTVLDTEARTIAATVGLELPPLTAPAP